MTTLPVGFQLHLPRVGAVDPRHRALGDAQLVASDPDRVGPRIAAGRHREPLVPDSMGPYTASTLPITLTVFEWRLPPTPRTKSMCRCRSSTSSFINRGAAGAVAAPPGTAMNAAGALGLVDRVDLPRPVATDLAGDLIDLQRLHLKMLP